MGAEQLQKSSVSKPKVPGGTGRFIQIMYREITDKLVKWKDSRRRKPLLLTGVRQCGKTYIVKEFGESNFDNCVYINFESEPAYAGIFEYDFDVRRILSELERTTKQRIIPEKSLLFFDEIQACPKALTSLKYFCENMRELHIIAAGSLLGVALTHENISFPVGKVNRMQLYPMNFREFVIASGRDDLIHTFCNWPADREIPDLYAVPMRHLLQDYLIVGGMPEAVLAWLDDNSYESAEEVQREILHDYEDDFGKYAPVSDLPKIRLIWDSVPVQLAKDNNKFVFSHVKQGKRAADLEDALQWLLDAGLICKNCLVEKPETPLSAFADKTYFKIYMSDTGLLRTRSGLSPETIVEGSANYIKYKGSLAENFVYNELISSGKTPYFWRSGNTAELDFLFEQKGSIIPAEVKSADNVQAKSYRQFCHRYNPETGFKLSMKNIGENLCEGTRTVNLPLYLTWNIDHYL